MTTLIQPGNTIQEALSDRVIIQIMVCPCMMQYIQLSILSLRQARHLVAFSIKTDLSLPRQMHDLHITMVDKDIYLPVNSAIQTIVA